MKIARQHLLLIVLSCVLSFAWTTTSPTVCHAAPAKKKSQRKPSSAKPTSSAQTKAIDSRLKQSQAALEKAKRRVQSTLPPVDAARIKHERAKQDVSAAKISLREIENNLDDYAEPGSPYGKARKAFREATDEYEKAKKAAEAAADSMNFKEAAGRFQFVQKFGPLIKAKQNRSAIGQLYAKRRAEALEENSQWIALKQSVNEHESNYRYAEQQFKAAVSQNSRARKEQEVAEKAILQLRQAMRISQAQDKQRAAIARYQAEQRKRVEDQKRRKQEQERRNRNNNNNNNKKKR